MSILARSLIRSFRVRNIKITNFKITRNLIDISYSLLIKADLQLNSSFFFSPKKTKFKFSFFVFFLTSFPITSYAQAVYDPLTEDPYIDPHAVESVISPIQRTESSGFSLTLGVNYGLNAIILLAPAVSIGLYSEPLVIGVEMSDSEVFPIWEEQRVEHLGITQFSGETGFVKWIVGESLYLMGAVEKRAANFWNRTFNRTSGYAAYDLFFKTTVASFGAGAMRFNDSGFMSIDIFRYSFLVDRSVEKVEHWETWTAISGNRDALDANIKGREDNWFDILDSPSGFIITFGYYF